MPARFKSNGTPARELDPERALHSRGDQRFGRQTEHEGVEDTKKGIESKGGVGLITTINQQGFYFEMTST